MRLQQELTMSNNTLLNDFEPGLIVAEVSKLTLGWVGKPWLIPLMRGRVRDERGVALKNGVPEVGIQVWLWADDLGVRAPKLTRVS